MRHNPRAGEAQRGHFLTRPEIYPTRGSNPGPRAATREPQPAWLRIFHGSAAVSWRSCKQTILTRSTMEAELTTLDTTTVEPDWLRELLLDLSIVEKPLSTIFMNYDNQIVIVKLDN
jgi:hypothetical protein